MDEHEFAKLVNRMESAMTKSMPDESKRELKRRFTEIGLIPTINTEDLNRQARSTTWSALLDALALLASGQAEDRQPPQVLNVSMQGSPDTLSVDGVYELQRGLVADSMPVWKKQALPERWLFSNTLGQWSIHGPSTKASQFETATPWVWQNEKHQKKMPHASLHGWLEWGSSKPEPYSIVLTSSASTKAQSGGA